VVKILQGSVVTQTTLGGLTVHSPVANFLQCICAKNYENWMTVDKVIAKIIWLTFFGPPCILNTALADRTAACSMIRLLSSYCRLSVCDATQLCTVGWLNDTRNSVVSNDVKITSALYIFTILPLRSDVITFGINFLF